MMKRHIAIGLSLFLFLVLVLTGVLMISVVEPPDAPATQEEKTLRVVMPGSQNEGLDFGKARTWYPWVIVGNVCDTLVAERDGKLVYQLASEITPNTDASQWTLRLRPGVRFSDGSALTSGDVFASLQFLSRSMGFGSFFQDVDFKASRIVDDRTLTLMLTRPRADLVTTVLSAASMVWKQGQGDAHIPVCSGAYRVAQFTASEGALLTRNLHAWQPALWFDRIEIRPLGDPTARVNALLSGAADFAFDIPVTNAKQVTDRKGFQVLRSGVANASSWYFALNSRVKPFDDRQVRQALKMLINRQQFVDVVLGGYGYVGNDVFGQGLTGYDSTLKQRQQEVAAAQTILREKGVTTLHMLTADLTPGLNDASELLRQQLADAGITLTLERVEPADYLSSLPRLHQAQMIAMFALNRPFIATLPMLFGAENPYNYGGWYPPEFAQRVEQARTTLERSSQQQRLNQLQQQLWEEGPYLLWGYRDQLSAMREGFSGVELSQGIPLFRQVRPMTGQE